ncbi:MAG: S24/S26 family peptidase [Parabacteroides sp.]|nr:S24/S26 family peptidase [Parabacteroides sp.]
MKQIPNNLFFAWVETEIAKGRAVRFRLKGDSMFPLIRNGRDEVVLYPCSEDELSPMDVVLFRYQGKHLLHRILRREGDQLFLQGDGSYVAKERCKTSDVVGIVREIIRPSGRVIPVTNWQWKLPAFLWQKIGITRTFLLRILHRFKL